ncbi:MAG: arylsulfotransferase family protein [Acidobacteriota bacterium]
MLLQYPEQPQSREPQSREFQSWELQSRKRQQPRFARSLEPEAAEDRWRWCPGSSLASGLLLAMVGVFATGCDRAPTTEAAPPAATAEAAEQSAPDVDALRALPYAGSAGPADPNRSGVVVYDPERSSQGYNLVIVERQCAMELLTPRGDVARRWELPEELQDRCQHWGHGEVLEDGSAVVIHTERLGEAKSGNDKGGQRKRRFLLRLDPQGEILWKQRMRAHHELDLLPDGRILALGSKVRTIEAIDPEVPVQDNRLLMISPQGEVEIDLSLTQLFLDADPSIARLQKVAAREKASGRETIGLLHCNGVQWIPAQFQSGPLGASNVDRALVTCRHQDLIFAVAWTDTPQILWAWGQGELAGPHDATTLPQDRVLVFDNGLGRGWSRILEIDSSTKEIVWSYRGAEVTEPGEADEALPGDLYTATRGSAQRLPNGNTLIAESEAGRALEVTPEGDVVWEYWSPHVDAKGERAIIPKIRRFEPSQVETLMRGTGAP